MVALLFVGACGDERHEVSDGEATSAAPFTVGLAVDGYRAVTAGIGTDRQQWGEDSGGTDEPVTAIRRSGTTGADGIVLISVTGFMGQEGELSQSSRSYSGTASAVTVDGHDGFFAPAGPGRWGLQWADLVVAVDEDLAIRVTAPRATQAELEDVFRHTSPRGQVDPPSVDLPSGYERIGAADAEVALASRSYVEPDSDQVPGGRSSRGVGWTAGPRERRSNLALVVLPGHSVDLGAVEAMAAADVVEDPVTTWKEVDGHPYLLVESAGSEERRPRRVIWMELAWGDVAMVRSVADEPVTEQQLLAILLGITAADDAAWDAMVIEATGGPGLHPDEGRMEIARGKVGDLEWLLQTKPTDEAIYAPGDPEKPIGFNGVDECIKLSDRTRACGAWSGSTGDWMVAAPEPDRALPPYVLLSTTLEAASVRVTTRTDQATAPLHKVPGEAVWAALVFVDDAGLAVGMCGATPPSTVPDVDIVTMRVDALDADGHVIGCLGFGPGSYEGGI